MIGPDTRVRLRKRADLQEQLIVELSRRTCDELHVQLADELAAKMDHELVTGLDGVLSRIFPARADAERVREAF